VNGTRKANDRTLAG